MGVCFLSRLHSPGFFTTSLSLLLGPVLGEPPVPAVSGDTVPTEETIPTEASRAQRHPMRQLCCGTARMTRSRPARP